MKAGLALYDNQVWPSTAENCQEHHGGKQVRGDFDLGNREKWLKRNPWTSRIIANSLFVMIMRNKE